MPESFEAYRYISYMRARWVWIASSCAMAAVIAAGVTLALPLEFTATSRVVVEPPAGTDPRSAMAVSPIYLESLKTYEHFAASDDLFRKALDEFHLRPSLGNRPIESLKKRVLKVGLVRNTRILEISATLPDARNAQSLARYLADAAVELNRSLAGEGDRDLLAGIERQETELRAQVQRIENEWAQLLAAEPVDRLQATIGSIAELRGTVQQQVLSTELEIAEAAQREKQEAAASLVEVHKEAANARARLLEISRQLQALDLQSGGHEKLLAQRLAHRDQVEAERKAAQVTLAAVEGRLREARSDAGSRGERLRIIDPGILPERPSAPNLPLNVLAAMLIGLVLPLTYFTLEMSYREQRSRERRHAFQPVARAGNE